MGGKDRDDEPDGFPDNIFQQMQAGHDKYMRELHDEGRRFQQDLESESKLSPGSNNFFVSFKDFIDSNLGNLADSFRSFPSNIAELRAKMQEERERRKQEELDIWRRWTGIEESSDHCQMLWDRSSKEDRQEAVDAALMLLREARDRNAHVAPEMIEALFRDDQFRSLDAFASPMLSPGGACYYQKDSGYNAPSTAIFRSGASNHRWLSIDWFKRSPYSPVTLEHHSGLQESGQIWRAAFEDLLNASLDKPMNSYEQLGHRPPHGKPQSTRTGPGLDWMLSLQCRGILPPQLPSWYNERFPSRSGKHTLSDELLEKQVNSMFGFTDVQKLIDEIATPAPPKGIEPRRDDLWSLTEQALYDQLERFERFAEQVAPDTLLRGERPGEPEDTLPSPSAQSSQVEAWVPTGNKGVDTYHAANVLFAALEEGDIDIAVQCLNRWHRVYGDIGDLIDEPMYIHAITTGHSTPSTWPPALNQALRQSELPDSGSWKQRAFSPHTELSEKADQLSLSEKRERRELMRRGDRAAGQTLAWPPLPSLEELKDTVERLEQERDALGLDTVDEQVTTAPTSTPATVSRSVGEEATPKVDVLSSLTTTHTTRLPDGTVTTKVVLKQRFADGREETEEKVHTYQEPLPAQQQSERPEEDTKKKGGWFWS